MISGRAIVVIGLVGTGLWLMKQAATAAAPVQGLGDTPVTDLEANALSAKLAAAEARIQTINQLLIPVPKITPVGPGSRTI